ncbi:hypothetical protein [Nostoc sphaeroides]|uniref:Uncharacterized protein n=1 Tax=Nostoc sphaeroides CCNUC1 TaxID=2653204 RepID=A0A5P8WFY6_9NOSO|nr:hypothetical protein [Nostoc sphaeroides]QFS51076.1 hypothetical protein GXM_08570 [Nostoc sphaeroides CCNUC1]
MDVWNLGKLGVVIVGAIALSGNSAIATINQGVTLDNNLNVPTLNTAIKKHNRLGDDALKINHNTKQTQFQNINAVGKKKILLACGFPWRGNCICLSPTLSIFSQRDTPRLGNLTPIPNCTKRSPKACAASSPRSQPGGLFQLQQGLYLNLVPFPPFPCREGEFQSLSPLA